MFRNLAMLGIWNYSEGNTGKDRIRLVILDREQWYNVTNCWQERKNHGSVVPEVKKTRFQGWNG